MARVNLQKISGAAVQNSIPQPLYDTVQIGTTAPSNIQFFQVPIGGTGITGSGTKTLNDTNVQMNGQLSAGDVFIIRGYEVEYLIRDCVPTGLAPTGLLPSDLGDARRLFHYSIFSFRTGSDKRRLIEVHPARLPCGIGLQGMVYSPGNSAANNVAYIMGNGVREVGNRFSLGRSYGEMIVSGENFIGQLEFNEATTFSSTFRVRAHLVGIYGQAISV